MLKDDRRDGIVQIMLELKKATLKAYLKSYNLPVSGTKLQLAMRIWDNTKKYHLKIMMPTSGTISIGIALDLMCDHKRTASGGASVFCADCGEDLV